MKFTPLIFPAFKKCSPLYSQEIHSRLTVSATTASSCPQHPRSKTPGPFLPQTTSLHFLPSLKCPLLSLWLRNLFHSPQVNSLSLQNDLTVIQLCLRDEENFGSSHYAAILAPPHIFIFVMVFIDAQRFLPFMRFILLPMFSVVAMLLALYLTNNSLIKGYKNLLLIFILGILEIQLFQPIMSLVHLCIWCEVGVQLYFSTCELSVASAQFLKDYSFSIELSWLTCQKSIDQKFNRLFLSFQFYPLIYVLLQYHTVLIIEALC